MGSTQNDDKGEVELSERLKLHEPGTQLSEHVKMTKRRFMVLEFTTDAFSRALCV